MDGFSEYTQSAMEILRDPHCGAFAVIRLCVYYVVFFALCCALDPTAQALRCLGLGFVLSRALSGALLTALPIAPGSSLARSFADAADRCRVRSILAVTAGLCLAGLALAGGWRMFAAAVCVSLAVTLRCARSLAGVIIDRFGKDSMLIEDGDGFTVTVRVFESPTFLAWVMGFGRDMQVLKPASTRDALARLARDVLSVYENNGNEVSS